MLRLTQLPGAFVRASVRALASFYYPKLEVSGRERLPATGPILLTPNHPNSVLDPLVVGAVVRRPVCYFVKAPLFRIPIFGTILRAMGMIPLFRGTDDVQEVSKNTGSLAEGAAVLARGGVLGIFPEGKSHDHLKVEQVRGGAARVAALAARQGVTGLKIIPVGINYEQKERVGSAVWVRLGEPIDATEWFAQSTEENERRRMRELTQEIDRRLKGLVIHLGEEKWEPLVDDLETLVPVPRESRRNPFALLRWRKRIADAMNHFLANDRPRAEALATEIEHHAAKLSEARLSLRSPLFRWQGWRLALRMTAEAVLMQLGFVLVLVGTLHHLLPFFVTRAFVRLVKAPGRATVAVSRLLIGLPVHGAWYLAVWWWMAHYFLPWVAWVWLLPMPVAGLLALRYWERVRSHSPLWWQQWRQIGMLFQRERLRGLRAEREALCAKLRAAAAEFAQARPSEPLPLNSFSLRRFALASARLLVIGVVVAGLFGLTASWYRQRQSDLFMPGADLRVYPPAALAAMLDTDERTLADMLSGLRELETRAATLQAEFASGRRSFYNQADNDAVRQLLFSYVTYRSTLLGLVWKYQNHTQVAAGRLQSRAFLLDFAAASTLYDLSLKFVTHFGTSPEAVKKLNEAEPAWNVPSGVYDLVKGNLLQSRSREFMDDAQRAYAAQRAEFARHDLVKPAPYDAFHTAITRHTAMRGELTPLLLTARVTDPIKEVKRAGQGAAYRVQSAISMFLGDTRIRQPNEGRRLITPAQLEQFRAQLKPGDILLERQNWFLSRAFMPGFWAHAALYVGTTNDLVRLGLDRDPRVQQHWKQFAVRDSEGREHVILEAVPQGVRTTTLEHCIGIADYAAVLRPKVSEEHIREAIGRAFSHLGKSYDFDFDFFTTDKIVCTELVYRCYDGPLKFPLVEMMGRKTLPPTELARKAAEEMGRPDAQLECVVFLDGDEARSCCVFKLPEAFRETIRRPGPDWFQSK